MSIIFTLYQTLKYNIYGITLYQPHFATLVQKFSFIATHVNVPLLMSYLYCSFSNSLSYFTYLFCDHNIGIIPSYQLSLLIWKDVEISFTRVQIKETNSR